MIMELDTRTIEDVVEVAENIAQAFNRQNLNTVDVVNAYEQSNSSVAAGIEFNLPEQEDRIFAHAMLLVKDIYEQTTSGDLDNDYAVIGARYLLMPERQFSKRCRECDDDLFELKKHYPHVSFNMIAHHIADLDRCFVCQRIEGTCRHFHKHQRVSVNTLDFKLMNRIADATLKAPDGIYIEDLTDSIRITGWKIGSNMVQIICYGDEL